MFLLIPNKDAGTSTTITHLHSTMFLLIPPVTPSKTRMNKFTFHNVSINSILAASCRGWQKYLHSTMFLLIPYEKVKVKQNDLYLHSTMFLLILYTDGACSGNPGIFTFHNVSINSFSGVINALKSLWYLHSTMFLLIRERKQSTMFLLQYLHSTMFLLIRLRVI